MAKWMDNRIDAEAHKCRHDGCEWPAMYPRTDECRAHDRFGKSGLRCNGTNGTDRGNSRPAMRCMSVVKSGSGKYCNKHK